jgi:hypothetical protein
MIPLSSDGRIPDLENHTRMDEGTKGDGTMARKSPGDHRNDAFTEDETWLIESDYSRRCAVPRDCPILLPSVDQRKKDNRCVLESRVVPSHFLVS